jgi:HPt (histidine-containing phosphotransfer) domain-containing protein
LREGEGVTNRFQSSELTAERGTAGGPVSCGGGPAESKIGLSSPAWDMEAALELVEGDRELVEELANLFAGECPNALAGMRAALEGNDAALLERLAHTMKGSSANIGATGTSQLALVLESQARSGKLDEAREQFRLLDAEAGRLLIELRALSPEAAT